MKKRIISMLMVILLIATLVPANVLALGIDTYAGSGVTFTTQPENVTVNVGENATFIAEAKIDGTLISSGLKYLWVENTELETNSKFELADIKNLLEKALSTESTCVIENVSLEDNGMEVKCIAYYIKGFTDMGYAESDIVTLTVKSPEECTQHVVGENLKTVEAKEPTCTVDGNCEYYVCSVCHRCYISVGGELVETTAANCKLAATGEHTPTHVDAKSGNCSEKGNIEYWECSVCGKYFTDETCTTETSSLSVKTDKDKANHTNLVEVEAKTATCTEEGCIHHWYCDGCGNYYSDEAGTNQIKKSAAILGTVDHTYVWVADETANAHYQQCSSCGAIKNTATHSGGTASCSAKAVCTVCGAEYGELDPNNHVNTELRNVKESTETEMGYTGDTYCVDCGALVEKGVETDSVCKHALEHHDAVEATCTAEGSIEYWSCSKCGKLYSDEAGATEVAQDDIVAEIQPHYVTIISKEVANSAIQVYGYDATGHWKECKFCGYQYTGSFNTHTLMDTEASCCTGTSKCLVCQYSDNKLDPTNHTGGTEVRGQSDSYTGDTYCLGCGQMIEQGREIGAACTTHTLEYVPAQASTCTEDGVKAHYRCTVCNRYYADEKATVEYDASTIVDKCTGHELHPGKDAITASDLTALIGALDFSFTDLIKGDFGSISEITIDSFLSNLHIKDIDHCYDEESHWLGCQKCGMTLEDIRPELEAQGVIIDSKWYEISAKTPHSGGTATCSEKASCDECGEKYGELGEHRYGQKVTEPTCTEKGYTLFVCTACGDNYEGDYVEALGHCFNQGNTCLRCNEKFPNPFYDVKDGDYFKGAVLWAYYRDPQITGGVTEGYFMPQNTCTRAQVVTFLWRAAGCPEPESSSTTFQDVLPNQYYYKAVLWANENGITGGYNASTFAPDDPITRAQAVTFLWRYAGEPTPLTVSTFSDVATDAYYFKAVSWAVGEGITAGYENGTFAPMNPCTRANIVTFLYRFMGI